VALVHQPKLVILDEPTNGLDPQGIADMRNLILRLSREMGKTVLVSSHLLSEIEQIASRMLIIDKGKKMIEGSVAELFASCGTRVHLKVQEPELCLTLLRQSQWKDTLEPGADQSMVLTMEESEVPQLTALLVNAGIGVLSIRPARSLEDYFLSLTAGKQHVASFTN
jgi:ABC-2 type transport system ATP-binding protein